jgi:hypothetical protein
MFEAKNLMKRMFAAAFLIACFLESAAFADALQDAARIFDLGAKLRPGMTIEALNELLGPPAEEHALSDKASGVTRYMWLHGEMGVEVYEVEDAAYRVDITLPCGNGANAQRTLGAMTREGNLRYGGMPAFDRRIGKYFWIRDGVRFAFSISPYNAATVMSSSMKAQ